jgi:hypothetical protein
MSVGAQMRSKGLATISRWCGISINQTVSRHRRILSPPLLALSYYFGQIRNRPYRNRLGNIFSQNSSTNSCLRSV